MKNREFTSRAQRVSFSVSLTLPDLTSMNRDILRRSPSTLKKSSSAWLWKERTITAESEASLQMSNFQRETPLASFKKDRPIFRIGSLEMIDVLRRSRTIIAPAMSYLQIPRQSAP
ncbi:hypothetical protein [Sinorhizobium meliloti]|uniref:hypothetical protein n=1 Tax=Rhizobium meliloti TaxID=382 RepID=UPI001E55821A|nr:hypothetical protein [Sinorhizobium meliloti]UFX13142.1 hypothetical protein SmelRRI128_34245 [Sinorhizobium meliloti]